jgi:hypothetical protein
VGHPAIKNEVSMENTENVSEDMPARSDNVKEIVLNYRVIMAFLLLLAVGGAAFPLVYAWMPHETSRRILALLLAIAIPLPWFAVFRMNRRNMKLLHPVKMNPDDRQALFANALHQSVALLCVVYAVIDVLSGNLFSHWG